MSKSIEAIREASFDAEFLEYIAEALATYDSYKPLNARKAAAAIRNCIKAHDAALSRASEVETRVRDECAEFLLNNYQDYATIAALCAVIRSMRPTGDSGVQS